MVKHHVASSVFNFTWNQVACAFWNRYPNPYSKHVLTEDIVHQEVVNGKLFVKKIITKTNKIPKWGEKFLLGSNATGVHLVEESIIDPKKKILVTYIRNVTMTSFLLAGEKTVYTPHKLDVNLNLYATLCERVGWTESTVRIIGVSRPIEAVTIDRFKKNIKSTGKGFEYVLNQMFPTEANAISASTAIQNKAKEKAQKAKEIATQAGQKVVTSYTGQTAA